MELKRCPFCGKAVRLMWWDDEHQNEKAWEPCDEDDGVVFPYIHCAECDCDFFIHTPQGVAKSVADVWNRRADNG